MKNNCNFQKLEIGRPLWTFAKKIPLVMKLFILCLFCSIGMVQAVESYAQNARISLKVEEETVADVLKEIEETSEFDFFYNNTQIDLNRRVSVSAQNSDIFTILEDMFAGTEVRYTVLDKKIILSTELADEQQQQQPGNVVKGQVVDATGLPVIGATVKEVGTNNGIVTDIDGNFSLTVQAGASLEISFVGYKTETVKAVAGKSLAVTLKEDNEMLDEIIVVGYGIQKKSDLISSVTSVKSEAMNRQSTLNVSEMLRGQAAGVNIVAANPAPGGDSKITIRGIRSLLGGSNPVFIVDGVPVSSLNDVNPNDIESLEILKDAAAQAIYGARASNGVILVKTKRGEKGKVSLKYGGYYGIQTVHQNFDVYSGEELAQLRREAYRTTNSGEYMPDNKIFSEDELEILKNKKFIDWSDVLLRNAPITNHNLSLTTGTDLSQIYTSINYQNQQGVIPNTDFSKLSFRANYDQKLFDIIKMGVNLSMNFSTTSDPAVDGILKQMVTASPIGKIYDDEGNLNTFPGGSQESYNPLLDVNETSSKKKIENNLVNLFFDVDLFKGLKYRLNVSRTSTSTQRKEYFSSKSTAGVANDNQGKGSLSYTKENEWQVENILTYILDKEQYGIDFTGVQSASKKNWEYFINASDRYPNDILESNGLASAEINTPSINAYERALLSWAARMQLHYQHKYFLTVSARADGSSVFGANNKWGFFPSVALGWSITQENFMAKLPVISNLKLRMSYGSVGNEAITPYLSLASASVYNYLEGGKKVVGYAPGAYLPNPNLKWETSTTFNMALDFGLFDNRLSGTIEYYDMRTTDLLVNRSLGAASGYTNMYDNIGEVLNRGVEVSLNSCIVDKKDLTINAGLTFAKNTNKIISLYGDLDGDGKEDDYSADRLFINHPLDVYWQPKKIGIWQLGEEDEAAVYGAKPGDIKLLDVDDNKVIDSKDNIIFNKSPKWTGSLYYNMTYKGVDFAFQIATVQGVIKENPYLDTYGFGGTLRGGFNGIKVNYWTPENPTNEFPRPNASTDPTYNTTMGLQDASYWRLQNIVLGYTFPDKLVKKISAEKIRIYCSCQNPLTITEYKSFSPEVDPSTYPEQISIVGGIQLEF